MPEHDKKKNRKPDELERGAGNQGWENCPAKKESVSCKKKANTFLFPKYPLPTTSRRIRGGDGVVSCQGKFPAKFGEEDNWQ